MTTPTKKRIPKNSAVRRSKPAQPHASPTPESKITEHGEQCALMEWTERMSGVCPELGLLFAIVNGAALTYRTTEQGKRYSPQAQKLLNEGMKAGVPDLCLPVARRGFHGMYIELKVKGRQPRAEQVKWIKALGAQGYYVKVCQGFDDAKNEIEWYLGLGIPV